jgi:hypothetical protein
MAMAAQFVLIRSSWEIVNFCADLKHLQFEVMTSTSIPHWRRESTILLQLCEYISFLYQHPIYDNLTGSGAIVGFTVIEATP